MRQHKHPKIEEIDLIDIMYALSDPTRVEIVMTLAGKGRAMTCGELLIDRPKSSMSHHFKILRGAGLVETLIKGTEHINSLRLKELEERFPGVMKAVLKAFRAGMADG
ncbi:helix-turn-helix transcriptional regulator [Luteolibacter yonseiensis]|uniref:Helix-turn-helix transcriptional regulator n=1 Tax=Luteolibacter yonseiensis TaxID=1144680 RepID=A0A934V8E9_9BACT|nr:helix-turn-helix domain-containing protein [Luteolibacter yonseiensis]MBK1814043.1 helix-turn-helix transcriptional regulator [Luteolibacter yonseiensis]